jgi:hypothetical protein
MRDIGHTSRLTDIKLTDVMDVNLQDITTLCPSLENLSLFTCSFLRVNTQFDPRLPHVRSLIKLKIDGFVGDHLTLVTFDVTLV